MFSLKRLVQSFGYAFNGLKLAIGSGQNIIVHVVAAIVAIVCGWLLGISTTEFAIVLLCIGFVISMEIINTAIEKICDFVQPQYHEKIKIIKDFAASAVLFMAIVSIVIAVIIFLPKILAY